MYSYTIRIRMEEGLSNANLPDMYLEMSILKDLNMFELKTVRNYIGKNAEVPKKRYSHFVSLARSKCWEARFLELKISCYV